MDDYYSDKNASLCTWFEQIDQNLREEIKKEWIADMNRLRVNLAFFLWFPTFASKRGMQNVFSIPTINVQKNLQKIWHFSNGSTLSSVHPPAEDLQIILKGEPILATPFRKGREGNDIVNLDDLKRSIKKPTTQIQFFRP